MKYLCTLIYIIVSTSSFAAGLTEIANSPQITEALPRQEVTLKEAVRLTLEHNPEFKSLNSNIEIVENRRSQAGFGPELELDIELENFGGSGNSKGLNSAETTVQLSKVIQLGRPTDKRVKIADYQTRLAETNRTHRQLEILCELAKSYITSLYLSEKTALARENLANAREIEAAINKRVLAGKDSPIANARAKIESAKAEIELNTLLKRLDYSLTKLLSYWNSSEDVTVVLTGNLENISKLPDKTTILNRLKNNPELVAKSYELLISKAQAELARAQRQPDITIAGGARYSNESNDSAFVVGLSIPLKNRRLNNHITAEASIAIDRAQYQQQSSELMVFDQVNKVYTELELSKNKLDSIKNEILALSEQIYISSKISYQEGKSNYLELLDAQKIYFQAQNDYIEALAEFHYAREELEYLVGGYLTETSNPEQQN